MRSSALGFHEGSMLLHAAGKYPTLLEVVTETVQNAIDKNARDIWVTINQKSRLISIHDDGDGVTQEEFEEALMRIGKTGKKEDALGRFGLGLVSPVGKCEKYTFTSTPRNDPRGYTEWKFQTEDIRDQKEVRIPLRTRPDLWFGDYHGKNITSVRWRTEVRLEKYTKDKFLSRLTMDSLSESISTKFNEAMKRKKVVVRVTITSENGDRQTREIHPKDFEGSRLPEVKISDRAAGDTVFRLFLARSTTKGRTGKVHVGEENNDFRITFAAFARSLPDGCKLSEEAVQALTSGIFEGDILSSRARFHSSRRGFEVNDALIGFAAAVDTWFIQHGLDPFMDAKETKQAERYQNLGLRSLKVIEGIVKSSVGEHLMEVINSFRRGTIGSGHVDKPGSETDYTSLSTKGSHQEKESGKKSDKESPATEHEGHTPFTAIGPRGQKRTVVRNGSLGIQLVHEPMGSDRLYVLDMDSGIMHMNVQHPLWIKCEEASEKILMRYQEYLILQALSIEAIPQDFREFARLAIDQFNAPYAFMLINADSLAGRIPNPRKFPITGKKENSKKVKSIVLAKTN